MLRRLDHCIFPIQLVLPDQRVRVSKILALEQGDVLKLNYSLGDAANLLVSGKELFQARPVRAGGRRAAQVSERVHSLDSILKETA